MGTVTSQRNDFSKVGQFASILGKIWLTKMIQSTTFEVSFQSLSVSNNLPADTSFATLISAFTFDI